MNAPFAPGDPDAVSDASNWGRVRLTPTEARIAELVVSGLSNPQVAHALGIGVKTVETHLARVYRKTGVRSRVELAAASSAQPSLRPHGPLSDRATAGTLDSRGRETRAGGTVSERTRGEQG